MNLTNNWKEKTFASLLLPCLILTACGGSDNDPSEDKDNKGTTVVTEYTDTIDYSKLNLVWQDEFDGKTVNTAKWNYRAEGTERGKSGSWSAMVDRSTIGLDGEGHCVIRVTGKDGSYQVGQLGTDKIFSQRYGYFECRAKMNRLIGPHVAFWLQSATMGSKPEANDPGTYGTEIDIFEYHRKTPNVAYFNLHWNGYGTYHQTTGSSYTDTGIGEGWHTFGLRWTQTEYMFYVDGKKRWTSNKAVSHVAEYMILSTELTGWGGDPATVTYPDSVMYDYVRAYTFK